MPRCNSPAFDMLSGHEFRERVAPAVAGFAQLDPAAVAEDAIGGYAKPGEYVYVPPAPAKP